MDTTGGRAGGTGGGMARLAACAAAGMLTAVSAAVWANGFAQPHAHERASEVSFPVTCSPSAQQEFNRAMTLFHAARFDAAKHAFARVLAADPACGMAHWGIALASMGDPLSWATHPDASLAGARDAADAARVGAYSQRERDYIAALGVLFRDWQTTDFRTRAVAFERAMDALSARYPKDDEAQILYAIALNVSARPDDAAKQRKATAILEPLYQKRPRHPGIAQYLIHSHDYGELGAPDVPSETSESTASAAPRQLPTHVYSRLGMWKEMVDDNRVAYAAAQAAPRAKGLGIANGDALRALDFMVFGHLQQAQDAAAKALAAEVAAISKLDVENVAAAYALAAVPARYQLERGDWKHAAMLRPSPSQFAWERFPQAEAIVVFARGLGAARSGDLERARLAAARLNVLHAAMVDAEMPYWPDQTEAQIRAVDAWIALAERRNAAALYLMREAVDREASIDRHRGSPGNVVPARELLGEMLLALNEPQAALYEFQRSLERDPNRFRGVYGAAQAAHAAGNAELARAYFAKLQNLAAERDSQRPELDDAEAFLTGRSVFVSEAVEAGAVEANAIEGDTNETQAASGPAGERDETGATRSASRGR